jgi:putative selenium metabolism protein SsnA
MCAILLKNASLVCFDPISIETCDLKIADGKIQEISKTIVIQENDELIDCSNKLVFPGIVCAHTHLYSALARGMPAPKQTPTNFYEILKYIWWRLDRALDEETIYWSAIAGGIDAIRSGTTTLIDHHASPEYITNSLSIIKQALSDLGLRAALCYEVTDRNGLGGRDLGVKESRDILAKLTEGQGLYKALVGGHAAFTLSDDSLNILSNLAEEFNCGVHIHVAEDLLDEEDAPKNYQMSLVRRLENAKILRPGTILAHCTHFDKEALRIAQMSGSWLIHNPRSNMNNSVGYARVLDFGSRSALGTDGIGADMFEEAKFAFYKSRDAKTQLSAESVLGLLAGGQHLASEIFNEQLQKLDIGTSADLVLFDYPSPTPLTADNFAWHFIFGMSSNQVNSVMVNGKFLLRDGKHQTINPLEAMEKTRQAANKLWQKMQEL